MGQSIIVALLSIFFYITSLFGGGSPEATSPQSFIPPAHSITSIAGERAQVNTARTAVRSGPSSDSPIVTSLDMGTNVVLLAAENGWYQTRYDTGQTGWIAGHSLDIIDNEIIANQKQAKKSVLGYYSLQSFDSMLEYGDVLTSISPLHWKLGSTGQVVADFNPQELGEALLFAGNHGLETYAFISDVSNVLGNPLGERQAINNIYATLVEWGVHGVNLELDNIHPAQRDQLSKFVQKLTNRLQAAGLKTAITVPAKTEDAPDDPRLGAYDYGKLADQVEFMSIQAYDQHHAATDPGPVAGISWVEEVIKYAVSQTSPRKIILGMAGFGYDWSQDTGNTLSYEQALELAARKGVNVKWNSEHKVPHFTYGTDNQVWFENRYSITHKLDLVNQYNLRGVAIWRLGQEDPAIWNMIQKELHS